MAPTRREFLVSAGALGATACVGEVEDDMTQGMGGFTNAPAGSPPWKMWGSTQSIETGPGVALAKEQLVTIDYRRPETWRFYLFARMLSGPVAGVPQDYTVQINLTLGVGTNIHQTAFGPGNFLQGRFAEFVFAVPAGQPAGNQPNNNKWTTVVRTLPLNDADATSFERVDHVVAQTIQCTARLINPNLAAGTAVAQVGAFFAPNVHVRPEWYADGGPATRFRGSEVGGS